MVIKILFNNFCACVCKTMCVYSITKEKYVWSYLETMSLIIIANKTLHCWINVCEISHCKLLLIDKPQNQIF